MAFRDLFMNMFVSMKMRGSHPLPGLDKRVLPVVRHAANTVFMLPRGRVYSEKYPFMGDALELLRRVDKQQLFSVEDIAHVSKNGNVYDCLIGRTLEEILADDTLDEGLKYEALAVKVKELWSYITIVAPESEFAVSLDSILAVSVGEVNYDSLVVCWNRRWQMNMDSMVHSWQAARHTHYFRVKDAVRYYDEQTGLHRLDALVRNMGNCGGIFSIECGSLMKSILKE